MRNSDKSKQIVFMDSQLASPNHDKIAIWLYKKLKSEDFVRSLGDFFKNLEKIKEIHVIFEPAINLSNQFAQYQKLAYADVGINIEMENLARSKYISVLFEVKTNVNLGETIRQINFIRQHKEFRWFVCAPAFSESNILLEQNIGFIEYSPE